MFKVNAKDCYYLTMLQKDAENNVFLKTEELEDSILQALKINPQGLEFLDIKYASGIERRSAVRLILHDLVIDKKIYGRSPYSPLYKESDVYRIRCQK